MVTFVSSSDKRQLEILTSVICEIWMTPLAGSVKCFCNVCDFSWIISAQALMHSFVHSLHLAMLLHLCEEPFLRFAEMQHHLSIAEVIHSY